MFGMSVYALIDPGSSHSYICMTNDKLKNLQVEFTENYMLVTNPLGDEVLAKKVVKDCPIEIHGKVFLGNLMELPFREFDVILGMDWLTKHKAMVDCEKKRVTLQTADGEEVTLVGKRADYLHNVISAMEARRLVQKGCEAYLVYALQADQEPSPIQSIPTVCDYPDVFPDDLPGLPPP